MGLGRDGNGPADRGRPPPVAQRARVDAEDDVGRVARLRREALLEEVVGLLRLGPGRGEVVGELAAGARERAEADEHDQHDEQRPRSRGRARLDPRAHGRAAATAAITTPEQLHVDPADPDGEGPLATDGDALPVLDEALEFLRGGVAALRDRPEPPPPGA